MKRKIIPVIEAELDKLRHFKFINRSMCRLQDKLNISTIDLYGILANPTLATNDQFTHIVWAGLIWEDPDLTISDVDNIIDEFDSNELAIKILEAFGISIQSPEEDETERKNV